MRINLLRTRTKLDVKFKILDALFLELCNEYDMDSTSKYFVKIDARLNVFVDYLRDIGYDIKMYSLPGAGKDILSWGLEINDSCPQFIALKLRVM